MHKDPAEIGKRLTAIFETVIDGVITIDSKGIIESVNPSAAKIFQYKQSELLGKDVSILMPQPHRSKHGEYIERYVKSKKPKIIGIGREVDGVKKDGTVFPVRLAVSEVQLSPDEIIFTGIVHDLSEIKDAENALKNLNEELENIIDQRTKELNDVINKLLELNHKYEAEINYRKKVESALRQNEIQLTKMLDREKELNELKSRFLSMASHEFKTPLSTILSSASLIRKYAQDEQIHKREKHLDRIKSSVDHLDAILNDFLSLSKLEEKKVLINKENYLVSEIFEEIIEEFGAQIRPGQKIIYTCTPSDLSINTDKRILKNIFFNLISNASKYSKEGQEIKCEVVWEKDQIKISIIDQGMGIPLTEQKHLFTRFFRASNALNIKGTGLGLHIVQEYLNLIDGSISFTSTPGKGSEFIIGVKQ